MRAPVSAPPALAIRFKKGKDGPDTLACVRPDGSTVVQRLHPVFPVHDFTHYAVETTLGLRHAFFGTLADGWDFPDFGHPWPRGPLPPEALFAELLVGFLWRDALGDGDPTPLEELRWSLEQAWPGDRGPLPRAVSGGELATIRATQRRLIAAWKALGPGETLALEFPLAGG